MSERGRPCYLLTLQEYQPAAVSFESMLLRYSKKSAISPDPERLHKNTLDDVIIAGE
jgi:hypothetical protein